MDPKQWDLFLHERVLQAQRQADIGRMNQMERRILELEAQLQTLADRARPDLTSSPAPSAPQAEELTRMVWSANYSLGITANQLVHLFSGGPPLPNISYNWEMAEDWPPFRESFVNVARLYGYNPQQAKFALYSCMKGVARTGTPYYSRIGDELQTVDDLLDIYEHKFLHPDQYRYLPESTTVQILSTRTPKRKVFPDAALVNQPCVSSTLVACPIPSGTADKESASIKTKGCI